MEEHLAMFNDTLPCNPIPFLNALITRVKSHDSLWLKSDEAKRIMWVILAMMYSQTACIDMCIQYEELKAKWEEERKEVA